MKKDTFLKGALILALGSLASRALGGIYRFILPWIMGGGAVGAEGMGLFNMAYPIYQITLSLSSVGVPLAVSKLVSEKVSQGDGRGALRIFRISLIILAAAGLLLSVLLALGGPLYAQAVIRVPSAALTITALAPAVLFVSLMSAYRGFFQGLQNMTPHAVSQVIEQVVRIATMFFLAAMLIGRGIEFAAAGATFGAVTGAVAGLVFLIYTFARHRASLGELSRLHPDGELESSRDIVVKIAGLAVPISLAAIVLPVMNMVDATLVPLRLQAAGYSTQQATVLYGDLSGYAVPFINLPAVFTSALAVSLVPAIAEAAALRSQGALLARTRAALRITFILTLPAMVGLYLLARQIPDMLWGRPEAGGPLAFMAAVALFLPVQQVSSGVLQGLGRPSIPMRNLLVGAILKLLLTWYLVAVPAWGVNGAALGTVLGFLIASSLNLTAVTSFLGPVVEVGDMVVKPVLAVAVMGVLVKASYGWVLTAVGSNSWATAVAIAIGALAYGIAILAIGGIKRRDLELLPRVGSRVSRLLARFGLLRD